MKTLDVVCSLVGFKVKDLSIAAFTESK